jgi:hypothetical protein
MGTTVNANGQRKYPNTPHARITMRMIHRLFFIVEFLF